ncbi:MotE family protein [Pseudogemmobacter sp. W21_MBD1_M6]|uniref:MotE family protein n=1 Tax=Pseudogemmobacter sp. W21_MBD1_M6 TaxID=3240271 RepID=UPI003F99C5CA
MLLASGLIRIAEGFSAAVALEGLPEASAVHASDQICPDVPGLQAAMDSMKAREVRIKTRESRFENRMQALRVSEEQIDLKLAALVAAESALSETLALADKAAEGDLARLTAVYENMKPKDAAALFEEMAPDFAAGFLARMRPDAAAGILAGLTPQIAYTISVVLAGRNANVPTE